MYKRLYLEGLRERLSEPRQFIQVLVGPRQVGKTTMANQLVKDLEFPYLIESADGIPAGSNLWIEQLWEGVRLKMKANGMKEFLLVIDEVQKISGWSEMVKRLWDEDTRNDLNIKLLLLGSSRLMLQQGLSESLAGRFEISYLPHWSLNEMSEAFGWSASTFAWFGGYPGSARLIEDEERWKRYISDSLIETSISKDILMLTRIDKPALLKRLFELGCSYSGQILSFTKILGQLQDAGNTTTLSHYLSLLDTAGLLGGIEKFAANVIRKRSSSPKFQVHNNALISSQRGELFESVNNNPKEWGRIVESAIGSHLINYSNVGGYQVFYWRDRGDEVDFILEKMGRVVAIEVKSAISNNNRGIEPFVKQYKPDKVYLIDNKNFTWEEFLSINPKELF